MAGRGSWTTAACLVLVLLVGAPAWWSKPGPSSVSVTWLAEGADLSRLAEVQEVVQPATAMGYISSIGRKVLQVVRGGATLIATSQSQAQVCVQQLQAVNLDTTTGALNLWQSLLVNSSVSNGGAISVFINAANSSAVGTDGTPSNVSLQSTISVLATVHAVSSTSLAGCLIKCPKKMGANIRSSYRNAAYAYGANYGYGYGYGYSGQYGQYGVIPRSSCMTRSIKVCPMANGRGWFVGNAVAMASAQAHGVATAGVDSNGNPFAFTVDNSSALVSVNLFKSSSTGFAYAQSIAVAAAASVPLAASYQLGASVELDACVNATATATVTANTPQLKDCLIDCTYAAKSSLKWGDRDNTWQRDPRGRPCSDNDCAGPNPSDSNCATRLVTQCFV